MSMGEIVSAELPVVLIPVDQIDVPMDRLRSLKHRQADAIGAAIVADRQYDPITVAKKLGGDRFTLIDGLHRLEGCRLHEISLIEARIVPHDGVAGRRQEILSAWARAEHDAFDKAAQIAEMARIARVDNESVDDPSAMIALAFGWPETVAETLGISRRTVFNYLKLGRHFSADQIALLRRHELADDLVPLLRLAALSPDDFDRSMLFIDETGATIAEALALVAEAATASPFAKKSTAFLTFLRAKASARDRADLMRQLNEEYLSDGRPRAKSGAKAG